MSDNKHKTCVMSWQKLALIAAVIVGLGLVCELFVFNFRHWESLFFPKANVETVEYSNSPEGNLVCELKDVNADVKNIRIDPFNDKGRHKDGDAVVVRIDVTDEANQDYLSLPQTEIVRGVPESEYLRLHLSGKCGNLRVTLFGMAEQFAEQGPTIEVNAIRPIIVRVQRVLIVIAVCVAVILFRPRSFLYGYELNMIQPWQRLLVAIVVIANLLLFSYIGRSFYKPSMDDSNNVTNMQYALTADSIIKGVPWIDIEPPATLEQLENPYDVGARNKALSEAGESAELDFAYYNGKYYSYFGVIPAVLFYVPYKVITGHYLHTGPLVFCICSAFITAVFWLLYEINRKYRLHMSIGLYLLSSIVLIFASGISYAETMANLYSVPIICSLLFGVTGLACWMRASVAGRNDCHQKAPDKEPRHVNAPRKTWLVLGSLLIALVMGCRPQMAIITLLAFPIFWENIRAGYFFTKSGIGNTLCVVIPYLVLGCGLMWYNVIRFGSPLNFGATYNLTGFDMTHRSFDPERFLLGFWEYLFQPLTFTTRFPYLGTVAQHFNMQSDYQGLVVNEPFIGGFFALNTIGFFIFGIRNAYKRLKRCGIFWLIIALVLCALIIIAIDIQAVGMTQRYHMDFSLVLMLAVLLVPIAYLREESDRRIVRLLITAIVLLSGFCVITQLITLLAEGRYNQLRDINPIRYYQIKYWLFSLLSIR